MVLFISNSNFLKIVPFIGTIFSRFFGTFVQLLVTVLILRWVGLAELGVYTTYYYFTLAGAAFIGLGFSQQLIVSPFSYSKNNSKSNAHIAIFFRIVIVFFIVILAVVILYLYEIKIWSYLYSAVMYLFVKYRADYLKSKTLDSLGFFWEFSVFPIIFLTLFSFFYYFSNVLSVEKIYLLSISIVGLLSFFCTVLGSGYFNFQRSAKLAVCHSYRRFSFSIWAMVLISQLHASIPYFFLELYFEAEEIGVFSVFHRIAGVLGTLTSTIALFVIVRNMIVGVRSYIYISFLIFLMTSLFCLMLYLFKDVVFTFLSFNYQLYDYSLQLLCIVIFSRLFMSFFSLGELSVQRLGRSNYDVYFSILLYTFYFVIAVLFFDVFSLVLVMSFHILAGFLRSSLQWFFALIIYFNRHKKNYVSGSFIREWS